MRLGAGLMLFLACSSATAASTAGGTHAATEPHHAADHAAAPHAHGGAAGLATTARQQQQRSPPPPPPLPPPRPPADTAASDDDDEYYDDADTDDESAIAAAADDGADPTEDKGEMEAELWGELDIDDGRDEPVLKGVVLLVGAVMLFGLWRAHCRGAGGGASKGVVLPGLRAGGWHHPVPLDAADADLQEWQRAGPGSCVGEPSPTERSAAAAGAQQYGGWPEAGGGAALPPALELDPHRPQQRRKKGFTFDIFSIIAYRLAL